MDRRQQAARDLVDRLWNERSDYWKIPPASHSEMLPIDPCKIARMLGLHVEEQEEIIEAVDSATGAPLANTAGIVDRPLKRIVIAKKFAPRERRFTLAHEIGHYVMHPQMRYHRDRLGVNSVRKPIEERDADLFATELLMPADLMRTEFLERFREQCIPNEELAYWLKAGSGRLKPGEWIDPFVLANQAPLDRARLVAQASWFRGICFMPLIQRFDVSPTAMARRLLEMRFVI